MTNTRKGILAAAAVAALAPSVASRPASAAGADDGPDTCLVGWVWREAFAGDHVCVTPAVRTQARADNAAAASRVDPRGAYGPRSCVQGYVWREARRGDYVCVTPATRAQARADNAAAASRRNAVIATYSAWSPYARSCDGDVCSTAEAEGQHQVVVSRVNVGRVWLGLYRRGAARPIWGRYVNATAAAGRPGGVAVFRTDLLLCAGRTPNAYFRAKDMTSGRWSATKAVATGCNTL